MAVCASSNRGNVRASSAPPGFAPGLRHSRLYDITFLRPRAPRSFYGGNLVATAWTICANGRRRRVRPSGNCWTMNSRKTRKRKAHNQNTFQNPCRIHSSESPSEEGSM
ncbi:Microtubule-actin cross-linking factor 1, isoforms 1/2/3/5 [Manis javanica]|nr:Microtubule-actin cross-linking factor 1, isoforms 1/2/3/5 [Manis javanica]